MVVSISIDGLYLDLPKQRLQLEDRLGLFDFSGKKSFSLNFSLGLTERNRSALGFFDKAETGARSNKKDCLVNLKGNEALVGTLQYRFLDNAYDCTLFLNRDTLVDRMKEVSLPMVFGIDQADPLDREYIDLEDGDPETGIYDKLSVIELPTSYPSSAPFTGSTVFTIRFDAITRQVRFTTDSATTVGLVITGGTDSVGDTIAAIPDYADAYITDGVLFVPHTRQYTSEALIRIEIGENGGDLSILELDDRPLSGFATMNNAASMLIGVQQAVVFPMIRSAWVAERMESDNQTGVSHPFDGPRPAYLNNFDPATQTYSVDALVAPCFFMNYILRKIAAYFGLNYRGDLPSDSRYTRLILFTGVVTGYRPRVDVSVCMPTLSVSEFLSRLAGLLCLQIDVDYSRRHLVVNYTKNLLEASPQQVNFPLVLTERDVAGEALRSFGYAEDGFTKLFFNGSSTTDYELSLSPMPNWQDDTFKTPLWGGEPFFQFGQARSNVKDEFRLAFWQAKQANADLNDYPAAAYDHLAFDATETGTVSLEVDGDRGLVAQLWQAFLTHYRNRTEEVFEGSMTVAQWEAFKMAPFDFEGMVFMPEVLNSELGDGILIEITAFRLK